MTLPSLLSPAPERLISSRAEKRSKEVQPLLEPSSSVTSSTENDNVFNSDTVENDDAFNSDTSCVLVSTAVLQTADRGSPPICVVTLLSAKPGGCCLSKSTDGAKPVRSGRVFTIATNPGEAGVCSRFSADSFEGGWLPSARWPVRSNCVFTQAILRLGSPTRTRASQRGDGSSKRPTCRATNMRLDMEP